MRGQNDASYQYAHALRDGTLRESIQDTDETYDLIVVGAGMSGLAAAYYYRKKLPHSKVLILDNCDDFGGHARRNEFVINGKLHVTAGGALFVWDPNTYPPEGKMLLADIGIDSQRYFAAAQRDLDQYTTMKLGTAAFFDKESWGADRLVPDYPDLYVVDGGGEGTESLRARWMAFLSRAPIDRETASDLLRIAVDRRDNLPGLSEEEKVAKLRRMSYRSYLKDVMRVGHGALKFYQIQVGWFASSGAAGPDSFSAWYAYRCGYGGFQGMGLPPEALRTSSFLRDSELGAPILLPDGLGGVARLLVRWLIPQALPGKTMEDAVATRLNYGALDEPHNHVRLRLSSTVVHAKHIGDQETAQEVAVTYVSGGRGYRVKARGVVMACFNAMVPYLCPDLAATQKDALHMAVRKPLVLVNVAVRRWRPFVRAGVSTVVSPTGYYRQFALNPCPGLGAYQRSQSPDEPTIVQFTRAWERAGLAPRDQSRVGRAELFATSLKTLESEARDQLRRALGSYGFDPDLDVAGVTVNRWAHGYATGANDLYDPEWSREELPWVKGRRRFGLIAIANSDASAVALTQGAFSAANRAVDELVNDVVRPQPDFHFGERV